MRTYLFRVGMYVIMLIALGGCSVFGGAKLPASTQNAPAYPNAQEVTILTTPGGSMPQQITKFKTRDKPEAVLAFYKDALVRDGWFVRDDVSTADELHMGWLIYDANSSTYSLAVFTKPADDGWTSVEVHLVTELPL